MMITLTTKMNMKKARMMVKTIPRIAKAATGGSSAKGAYISTSQLVHVITGVLCVRAISSPLQRFKKCVPIHISFFLNHLVFIPLTNLRQ
jgi:hypothetical protein